MQCKPIHRRVEVKILEGYRATVFDRFIGGPPLHQLPKKDIVELWRAFDTEERGRLVHESLEAFVHAAAHATVNIMRPLFYEKYRRTYPGATTDDCNLAFDRIFQVYDMNGSAIVQERVREHLLGEMRPRNLNWITRSEFVHRWNAFASAHFLPVWQGKLGEEDDEYNEIHLDDDDDDDEGIIGI